MIAVDDRRGQGIKHVARSSPPIYLAIEIVNPSSMHVNPAELTFPEFGNISPDLQVPDKGS
jgi:hypothetical protein